MPSSYTFIMLGMLATSIALGAVIISAMFNQYKILPDEGVNFNSASLAKQKKLITVEEKDQLEKYDLVTKWGGSAYSPPRFGDPSKLGTPRSVAIDSENFVYVAGHKGMQTVVQKFSPDGIHIKTWALNEQFTSPRIAIDESGNIYILDFDGRLEKFDNDLRLLSKWNVTDFMGKQVATSAIALDEAGFIYIGENYSNQILKFTNDGKLVSSMGSECIVEVHLNKGYGEDPCKDPDGTDQLDAGNGQFAGISSIAFDSEGFMYVADTGNSRIQKLTKDGEFVLKWGSNCLLSTNYYLYGQIQDCKDPDGSGPLQIGEGQFYRPLSVAVSEDGFVYVVEFENQMVQKFTKDGRFVSKLGSYCNIPLSWGCTDPDGSGLLELGDGQFDGPTEVDIDARGFVYVLDGNNGRIQRFTADGKFVTKWGESGSHDGVMEFPEAIAVDKDGNVYVAGGNYGRIQKFSSNGTFLAKWGIPGSGSGQLYSPQGAIVSDDGFLYVADSGNNRVQKFSLDGKFITDWGSVCSLRDDRKYGCVDPDGLGPLELGDGQFSSTFSMSIDSNGNVYVSDGNGRIQKFDSKGNFITKWGNFCTLYGYTVYTHFGGYTVPAGTGCKDPDRTGPQEFGDGQFMPAPYIAVDATNGFLYASDVGNNRTQKFALDGKFLAKYDYFGSIAVDKEGNVFVVDRDSGTIRKITENKVLAKINLEQFEIPRNIAVDDQGNVYVLDMGLSVVQRFELVRN